MKRIFVLILAGLAAVALFGGLVHVVLVAAQVSEPAATTIYGSTPQRLWASTAAVLALVGVVIGVFPRIICLSSTPAHLRGLIPARPEKKAGPRAGFFHA